MRLQTDAAAQSADPAATHRTRPDDPRTTSASSGEESGQIGENIAAVHEFYVREELKRSASQRHADRIGGFVGRPAFLIGILLFVSVWMLGNEALGALGLLVFDPPPFAWLQGMIALASLLATTMVLIKQNRVDRLSEQRAHLDLKVTLLIEQKTAKLIDLLEELRRDLPNVKDRVDSGASLMQNALSPAAVLTALDEEVTALDGSISASTAVANADLPVPEGGAGG